MALGFTDRGFPGASRAHKANTMAGHLGAALVAGSFFSQEHSDLDARVHAAIEGEWDRIMAGEESWFDAKKAGMTVPEMFEPMPEEAPQPERIDSIADALSQNIGRLRESGHNVIFASLAIRALHEHPEHAAPSFIDGICKLIAGFNGAPGGKQYFGR